MAIRYQVVRGDCRSVLRELRDECVDSFPCDPPYGIGFMSSGWDYAVPGPEYWAECLRVAKPGAHLAAFGGTKTSHRLACAIEDAGWELRDTLYWLQGEGMPKGPSTSRQGMDGRATCLKPAVEPIVLARKPFRGSVLGNLARYGTGALWIDACRIPTGTVDFEKLRRGVEAIRRRGGVRGNSWANDSDLSGANPANPLGRWPANVILDSDVAAELDALVGDRPGMSGGGQHAASGADSGMFGAVDGNVSHIRADSGGPSKYFYVPKAKPNEREAGLDDFPWRRIGDGRAVAADTPHQRGKKLRKNPHPTVKPISLMEWVVKLITPPGGLAVDPFCGSGSTGCAAVSLGYRFLGIDLDRENFYCDIARARIAHWTGVEK